MALRPVLITGVALASAGAIVAATPGLITPPDITIAAGEASVLESKKSVTVDRLNLLALSDIDLQTISDIFNRVDGWGGHVGSSYDPYYGGSYQAGPLYVQTGVDADGVPVYAQATDKDGKPLAIVSVDSDGNPVVTGPVYIAGTPGEDGTPTYVPIEDPKFDKAEPISGEIYRDGLVGLAYYLGDQLLEEVIQSGVPVISDAAGFMYDNVTSYFYEAGIEETFRVVASELTGGVDAPVGQALATAEYLSHNWLSYAGTIAILAASGVPLAGPDLATATSIFFFGGPVVTDGKEYNQGIDGVINYAIDRVLGAPVPSEPEPEDTDEEEDGSTADVTAKGADGAAAKSPTAMLASARKALPALDKLINLDLKVTDDEQTDGVKLTKATVEENVSEAGAVVKKVVEESVPEEKPSVDPTSTETDPSAEGAEDGSATDTKADGTKPKKRGWSKLNLKGDKASRDDVNTESSENTGGGKHRQGKPGSWTPKVHDRGSDESTGGDPKDSASNKTETRKGEKKNSTGSGDNESKDNKDK